MKTLTLFSLLIFISCCSQRLNVLELDSRQSMCITGKGPGQDGAINPFIGQSNVAIVKNQGQRALSARVQEGAEIIQIKEIPAGQTSEINLKPSYQLYFDAEGETTAKVRFRKAEK